MQMLTLVKTYFASDWVDVGYQLIKANKVEEIQNENTSASAAQKCTKMLQVWLTTDGSASYEKLISALNDLDLKAAALKITDQLQQQ